MVPIDRLCSGGETDPVWVSVSLPVAQIAHGFDATACGSACPQAQAPRDIGSMTGRISNCRIFRRRRSAAKAPAWGHAACWSGAPSATQPSPISRPGARPEPGIATLVAVAGQRWTIEEGFETAKTKLGLDHKQPGSGTAGTGTSHW